VHGVETNEASRFIDHTVATPWETLLNDIETALRTVSKTGEAGAKVDIYYYGLTYKLEKRKSTNQKKNDNKITTKSERDFSWLQTTFNIGWFVIFSQGHHSSDYHPSYRTTMLSAFVTAVRNVGASFGLPIPVFFTYSYVIDISHAADLIGYSILPQPPTPVSRSTESTDQVVVARPRWCRYEAHICPVLHFHPQFEYFDGIRMLLKNQFHGLRLAGPAAERFFVETEFSFINDHETIYGSIGREGSTKIANTKAGEEKKSAEATGVSIFNSAFLKRLAGLIPCEEVSSTIMSEVVIELTYSSQAQGHIVDNAFHTSYQASKQLPSCWSVSANFKTLPKISLGELGTPPHHQASTRNPYLLAFHSAGSESALSASWMSRCVRKLLSFYLLSVYCTRAKVNIETMSAEIEATANLLDKHILDRIVEVLSDESKEVFYAVCRQQIDSKLTAHTAHSAPNSPMAGASTPKGRMASVVRESSAGFTSPGRVASPSRGGRTSSVVATPSGGMVGASLGLGAVAANLFGGGEDGWTARMERHRAVVEILFSGECVFGPDVMRGSGFDTPVSSTVGLWMSMFSVLCASSAVDAHDMANMWSKCMRRVHIANEDGQPLPTFTPATQKHTESPTSGVSPRTAPICLRTLWDDAIERLHDEDTQRASSCQSGLLLAWPDQNESLVVQKLQQLQFCIATQNESPVYHFPELTVTVDVTESPPTQQEEKDKTEEPSAPESTHEPTTAPHTTTTRRHTVNQPALFRRLPLTDDMIAMNKYLARKLNLTTSRSNKEHPTLKVQLLVPSILSDIKAFKAANPDLDLLTFCQWYGIEPVSTAAGTEASSTEAPSPSPAPSPAPMADRTSADILRMLKIPLEEIACAWASCEPASVEDQGRALFLVEKESEKAMAFLESVSAVQLASEMLTSGIHLLVGVISKQFDPWLAERAEDGPPSAVVSVWRKNIRSDLALLKEQAENAVHSLRPQQMESNTPSTATPSGASGSSASPNPANVDISINALIFVDSVAGLIQKLEMLSIKLQTLSALFKGNKAHSVDNLIHTLSRKDACTAETEAEMTALYELTRALHNFKAQTHDWQSRDGRELGEPSKKTFTCKLNAPRTPQLVAGAPTPASGTGALFVPIDASAVTVTGGAQMQAAVGGGVAGPAPLTAASSVPEVFHMEVTVQHKQLRLAFRVPEDTR